METRTHLDMRFITSLDKERSIRLANPREYITGTMVQNAGQDIVSANPFDHTVGSLIAIRNASLVTVSRNVTIQSNDAAA